MRRHAKASPARSHRTIGSAAFGLACLCLFALATVAGPGTAAAAECPNEAIRLAQKATHLPGCWAYEQVTPVDKGGAEPVVNAFAMTNSDASGLVFSTRAAIGSVDPSSAPYSPAYLATKNDEGWTTQALDIGTEPEVLSAGLWSTLVGVSKDLSHSVVVSRQVLAPGGFAGGGNLYRRDLRTGQYEFIAGRPDPGYYVELVNMPGASAEMLIGASDNFDRLVFESTVPLNAEGGALRSYIYEWTVATGLALQSREDGEKGTPFPASQGPYGPRDPSAVSADGRQILLINPGIDPVLWTPIPGGVYVRIDGKRTEPISYSRVAGEDPEPVPAATYSSVGASENGRFIAFSTESTRRLSDDAPAGNGRGLYLYDRDKPVDEQLRFIAASARTFESPILIQVTGDGTVYFTSTAQLRPGATLGSANVYVWRNDEIKLVVRGDYGFNASNYLASPNGRYFAFTTRDPAVTGSNSPSLDCGASGIDEDLCAEVAVYDADSGTLECASCTSSGRTHPGNASLGWVGTYNTQGKVRPVLTDDGTVYFDTPNDLVAGDSNGSRDVYSFRAGVHQLISRGAPGASSRLLTVSDDGSKVFIVTNDPIVGQDRDNLADIYVTGTGVVGIPAQNPVESGTECTGGACRESVTPIPPSRSLGSADVVGKGNAREKSLRRHSARHRAGITISAPKKVVGQRATIMVRVPAAGRVVVGGHGVRKSTRLVARGDAYRMKASLTAASQESLRDRRQLGVRVRIVFRPRSGGAVKRTVALTYVQPTKRGRTGR